MSQEEFTAAFGLDSGWSQRPIYASAVIADQYVMFHLACIRRSVVWFLISIVMLPSYPMDSSAVPTVSKSIHLWPRSVKALKN